MQRESLGDLRLCLFGAAPDTGNLGVSALCHSVLAGLARVAPEADITVFDHGRGRRTARTNLNGTDCTYHLCGAYHTRRYYRPESLWQIRVAAWFGGLWNDAARCVARANAVLDISGGDSFSDIYGARRFQSMCLGKHVALEAGTPLVLLPQTYGPYHSREARKMARSIVRRAAMAWARDEQSFESLAELLGEDLDPARHRSGVDVAFDLPPRRPRRLSPTLERWLQEGDTTPVVGLNVSGLIHGQVAARDQYGLEADYTALIHRLVERLLADGVRVVLVPHVAAGGTGECDGAACQRVLGALGGRAEDSLMALDGGYDPSEAKWIISRLEFFCGTRMHACIAALSSGVPTAGLAYSKKTRGVFATCGQGDAVADLRAAAADEIVEQIWGLWQDREPRRVALAAAVPDVVASARKQMRCIVEAARRRGVPQGT